MERTVLLVNTEQRAKLSQLAKREHVSVAEINRRAIDAYEPDSATHQELEQLAEAVIKSSSIAMRSAKEAQHALAETLNYFQQQKEQNNGD